MKHPNILYLLILLMALTLACRHDNTPAPLNFKGYEHNPVLLPGEPGSWDDLYVINAFVLEDKGIIYLFYTAYDLAGSRALGLATSKDGVHFTKFEENPILTGDGEGYDAFGVAQAHVLKEDSLWVLYFNGREIAGFSSGMALGRATARSLTGPWTKSKDPVIAAGRKGEWDSYFIYMGSVRKLQPEIPNMQGGKFLFRDSLCFMYYDYGHCDHSAISLAIAEVKYAPTP